MDKFKVLIAVLLVVVCLTGLYYSFFSKKGEGRLFGFYLPWDDSVDSITNLSGFLDKPAGLFGYVYVGEDGHLYAGTKRIKFLGVNICGRAAFPDREDAEKISARLAKFGVNIVRFHHMDAPWESFNIFDRSTGGTRVLNGQALNRLDYFIAMLKENGIYVDLNLLVSRQLSSADGLPVEVESISWKDQQVLGFFVDEIMQLHREYAKNLLTHYNPYTMTTYAEEPSVAVVEIVNEQGLLQGWLGGALDKLPSLFRNRLRYKWNEYLLGKYGSTGNLEKAWGVTGRGRLEEHSLEIVLFSRFKSESSTVKRDWVEFLWKLEEEYFKSMYTYLKNELKVKSLIIGTITSCSTINIQAQLDAVDTHNYWSHPVFPDKPWDPENWYVVNEPMVNHPEGSTIPDIALRRVYGKPHFVTEYNHPAPNMYDAEAVVTLAAYAALQDWNGIFFDYGSYGDWDSKMIRGYFDVDQHPVKMASLIPAYMIFIRGDVNPSDELVVAQLSREKEVDVIVNGMTWAWRLIDGVHVGFQRGVPLVHRTALIVEGNVMPSRMLMPREVDVKGPVYKSDNGQVTWDVSDSGRGVIVVNTSRSIALIGFCGGKSYDFDVVVIEPGKTLLEGWSLITLSVMRGDSLKDWRNLLLIAAGYTINNGTKIMEYSSGRVLAEGRVDLSEVKQYNGGITCRRNWGKPPTLTEGVIVTVKIKTDREIDVWALDNRGRRRQQVPVQDGGDYKTFTVGLEYATIWYEIVAEK